MRFLRLEPFTDRAVWTQHIGALAKNGDPLGVSRLQLIMRHLALRRTKASVDKDGKPILSLPPNNQKIVHLAFDPAEHAFYRCVRPPPPVEVVAYTFPFHTAHITTATSTTSRSSSTRTRS